MLQKVIEVAALHLKKVFSLQLPLFIIPWLSCFSLHLREFFAFYSRCQPTGHFNWDLLDIGDYSIAISIASMPMRLFALFLDSIAFNLCRSIQKVLLDRILQEILIGTGSKTVSLQSDKILLLEEDLKRQMQCA